LLKWHRKLIAQKYDGSALANLGHKIGRTTVADILKAMGLSQRRSELAKQRGKSFFADIGIRSLRLIS
jgi:hypothetical protein